MPISQTVKNNRPSGPMMPPKLRLKLANECQSILSKCKFGLLDGPYIYHMLRSDQINEVIRDKMMSLFELLMRSMYEASSWGWNPEEKISEWTHKTTKVLLVTKCELSDSLRGQVIEACPSDPETIIGFMNFRFEIGADKKESAFYVYELHIDPQHQRHGIGKSLMDMAKTIAREFKMEKVMLTSFRSNSDALQFYNKLKYKPDRSSPSKDEADYVILSIKL